MQQLHDSTIINKWVMSPFYFWSHSYLMAHASPLIHLLTSFDGGMEGIPIKIAGVGVQQQQQLKLKLQSEAGPGSTEAQTQTYTAATRLRSQ